MRRVAILHHPLQDPRRTLLGHVARRWVAAGVEVLYLCDPAQHRDADLAILHVDLTRVPDPFAAWARRFPRTLNGRPPEVRKRAVSTNLVRPGDGWGGPVIVKTDLNYGGRPERALAKRRRGRWRRVLGRVIGGVADPNVAGRLPHPARYPVYPDAATVPAATWADPALVVERFLPERVGSHFALRKLWCLGDRTLAWRALGTCPVVKASCIVRREPIAPSAAVDAWRRARGLDYGKVEYVQPGAEEVVIDLNPTPGLGGAGLPPAAAPLVEFLAAGLDALWPRPGAHAP